MRFNACREREAETEEQALLAQIRLDQQELSRLREARALSKAEAEAKVAVEAEAEARREAGEPKGELQQGCSQCMGV